MLLGFMQNAQIGGFDNESKKRIGAAVHGDEDRGRNLLHSKYT
jgi:hypothetical protein